MHSFRDNSFGDVGGGMAVRSEGKEDSDAASASSKDDQMSIIHFARAFIFLNAVFAHPNVAETLVDEDSSSSGGGEGGGDFAAKAKGGRGKLSPKEFMWDSLRKQASMVQK